MLIKIHPVNPEKRIVKRIVDDLKKGKIYILPTDTVYALVCLIDQPKAISSLYKIKNLDEKHHLSLLCRDISMVGLYVKHIPDRAFKLIKNYTPGPYTFIFPASKEMDRRGVGKRKEVGVRIVNHPLHRLLFEYGEIDKPLVSTSVRTEDDYITYPEHLDKLYGHLVEAVIDDGPKKNLYSTIIDCTKEDIEILREGKGPVIELGYQPAEFEQR
ncbi:MAG: L-threonylcarbamoyladenylate synthase [Leptospiraceae bacterium]|nr:L-threonylcarbamoyladenylate synthase [Leptospiraceae bacterium]